MERNRSIAEKRSRQLSGAAVMRTDLTEALTRAFFAEWARAGYAGLSLERVAQAAGAGKAALYRRWPDKATMAAELLARVGVPLTDVAEQGSFEGDLLALLLAFRRVLRHRIIRGVIADIHAELDRNPALARVVRPFQDARRARIGGMIDRAVARGELPSAVDRDMVADLVAAPLYWRMAVLGRPADRSYLERLAGTIAASMRAEICSGG